MKGRGGRGVSGESTNMRRAGVAGEDAREDRRADTVGDVRRVGAGEAGGLVARRLAAWVGGRVEARADEREAREEDWGDQSCTGAARYEYMRDGHFLQGDANA